VTAPRFHFQLRATIEFRDPETRKDTISERAFGCRSRPGGCL